jgi:hypothetical protein
MSIKSWIRNWLHSDGLKLRTNAVVEAEAMSENSVQIGINHAINGRVLSVRTYQPTTKSHRPDWITEMYVIKEGESLTDALTMLLMMKGVDK